jgi:hypothetical protein
LEKESAFVDLVGGDKGEHEGEHEGDGEHGGDGEGERSNKPRAGEKFQGK